ncbi:MAG: response regulator [Bacteroidetes bacterium]|nr:response regulator [Bacteroidota bacterium]
MTDSTFTRDILIADDDTDDVDIFKMAMDDINVPYIIRHAENGDRLFVLLKDRLPYILFLDIRMPCKDGMACIAEIRQNKEYDQLPVIMYTSNSWESITEESFRKGANFYLPKPEKFEQLTDKLKKIFSIDWQQQVHYPPQSEFILK